jgi:O-antigen ligase
MRQVALFSCIAFIVWLLAKDRKLSPGMSHALWIPTLWVIVLGSRPISLWFGAQESFLATDDPSIEGSTYNRNFYLGMILIGIFILVKRQISWRKVIRENRWLFIFFLYFLVSTLWSEYTFVSLKRWFKNFGNIVMVLIVLTEEDPWVAMKSVFLRAAYILMPLSVLFIKYYGDIGRYFNITTWEYAYGGVTRDKNELGASLITYGVFLFANFFELRDRRDREGRLLSAVTLGLLVMCFWLLHMARSSTSLVCTVLGMTFVWLLRKPNLQAKVARASIYVCAIALTLFYLQVTFGIGTFILDLLGRDVTFTGRTIIWDHLLQVKINPIFGVGFYSFWLGDRVAQVSDGFFFRLNEAHNGYLETYLDGGLVGLGLLIVLLFTMFNRLSKKATLGDGSDAVRLIFVIVNVIYNITEAHFNRQSLIWVLFLMSVTQYWQPRGALYEFEDEDLEGEELESAEAKDPDAAYPI